MGKSKQPISFSEYFAEVYGDRWPALESALQAHVSNMVSISGDASASSEASLVERESLVVFDGQRDGLYQLDLASVLCTLALPQVPGGKFLDLCAAPGGKSLSVIYRHGGDGRFVLNDVSESRLVRLKRVIKEHSEIYGTDSLEFYKRDASRWGLHEPESYDVVICDVPCSSEAHGKARAQNQKPWSLKTTKTLAVRQLAILCSGFDSLKSRGHLLYSTCSINPMENDQVIEKFHKKRSGQFAVIESELAHKMAERTRYGQQMFPDRAGIGPIYFCLIKKRV